MQTDYFIVQNNKVLNTEASLILTWRFHSTEIKGIFANDFTRMKTTSLCTDSQISDNIYASLEDCSIQYSILIKYEKQTGKFCPFVYIFHNLFSLLD